MAPQKQPAANRPAANAAGFVVSTQQEAAPAEKKTPAKPTKKTPALVVAHDVPQGGRFETPSGTLAIFDISLVGYMRRIRSSR